LAKFRQLKVIDRSLVRELPATTGVFGSTYVFHLIVEGLTVCPFCRSFFSARRTVLPLQGFEVTHAIFDDIVNTLSEHFHHFHCQTPLKNAKFDLFGSENAS